MDQFTDRPTPIGGRADNDAPLVDEVIEAIRTETDDIDATAQNDGPSSAEQVEALRAELEQLRESISLLVSGSRQVVAAKINEQPLGSVMLVAALAYLFGRMR